MLFLIKRGFIRHEEGRLSRRITSEVIKSLESNESSFIQYPIANQDRSMGARLSGEISLMKYDEKLIKHPAFLSFFRRSWAKFWCIYKRWYKS